MKKIFTLIFALIATISLYAQQSGPQYYVGPSTYGVLSMKDSTPLENVANDTVIYSGNTIVLPELHAMGFTIESITVNNVKFTTNMAEIGRDISKMVITFTPDSFQCSVKEKSGRVVTPTVKLNSGSFTHATNTLSLDLDISGYGTMPAFVIVNYVVNAVYDKQLTTEKNAATAINNVDEANAPATAPVFDLQGRKVTSLVKGQLYIQNGRKFVY